MITPQELETKEFGVSFRGYDKDEIDDFLDALQKDYEHLYKENANLKSKMAVLVAKIDEYKEMEESLRNALLTAQKMGENMMDDAKSKSELIVNEARLKAERILGSMNTQLVSERQKLEAAKRENEIFKARISSLYQAQIRILENSMSGEKGVIDDSVRATIEGAKELAKIQKEVKESQPAETPAAAEDDDMKFSLDFDIPKVGVEE
ncbi:MAG: DivIVA domain-containing protein [Eubacteriales bacterium]|jgi:cell division initiation protein